MRSEGISLLFCEMLYCFFNGGDEHGEALGDGFRIAGEVEDEGLAAGACGGAGQNGGGDFFKTPHAHGLAEAGEFAVEDGAGGFGGVVAGGGAGAAGGEDELALFLIAEGAEEGFYLCSVIGHDVAVPFDSRETGLGEDAFDFGAAEVLVDACAGAVAKGEAGDFHGEVGLI